jgi:hypothetical protein
LVGIVRPRTQAMEFFFIVILSLIYEKVEIAKDFLSLSSIVREVLKHLHIALLYIIYICSERKHCPNIDVNFTHSIIQLFLFALTLNNERLSVFPLFLHSHLHVSLPLSLLEWFRQVAICITD